MAVFKIIADIVTTRSYEVEAETAEQALQIVRADYNYMNSDVIDTAVQFVSLDDE